MFSKFLSANSANKDSDISIQALVKLIKNHPQKDLITKIRALRAVNDDSYKDLKKNLIAFTPNCVVNSARKFTTEQEFKNNFKLGSGYMYFDIDDVEEVYSFKAEFIERYADLVSIVTVSSSLGGLSILVKVDKEITSKEEYEFYWEYFKETIFSDYTLDSKTRNFGRINYITFDSDVYINYDNEFQLPEYNIYSPNSYNNTSLPNITGVRATLENKHSKYSIRECLDTLIFETPVEIGNRIFDMKEVEYCNVFFSKGNKIKKGEKAGAFFQAIQNLIHLNPNVDIEYIYSYIYYININYTTEKASCEGLRSLFESTINIIERDGLKAKIRNKTFHLNSKLVAPKERKALASKMTGLWKKKKSIFIIETLIAILEAEGKEATKYAVKKYAAKRKKEGLLTIAEQTIQNNWDLLYCDFDLEVQRINEEFEITYQEVETKDNEVLDSQI